MAEDIVAVLNAFPGWVKETGIVILTATPDEVTCAVRSGRLHANARPVTRGRTSQVWEAWIRDEKEQLVAQGRVRLRCIDEERALG